ncbi:MAG: tryptophan-rich sensory protein [Rhizobiales bacterium]|nr:tryptophan-rich sensory protein [Hyphomicrobiales bacterium]
MNLSLLAFLGIAVVAASSGALFRPGEHYERLNFPSWRPPNYLFAPVWTVLYIMIAVSGWLVYEKTGWSDAGRHAMIVYGIHFVLNYLWSAIFFGLKQRGLALFEMALLWLSIVVMIVLFYPISKIAAYLLVPYLCWVSFAFVLNHAVWSLNRGVRLGEPKTR